MRPFSTSDLETCLLEHPGEPLSSSEGGRIFRWAEAQGHDVGVGGYHVREAARLLTKRGRLLRWRDETRRAFYTHAYDPLAERTAEERGYSCDSRRQVKLQKKAR